jgi:4-hydroxybutyryl-CoA dehydratase / vinylacetyl-CoA-Delta-isomerase
MKREIWRNYPIPEKTQLVENLLDRGVTGHRTPTSRQPGKCCATGCQPPALVDPIHEGAHIS